MDGGASPRCLHVATSAYPAASPAPPTGCRNLASDDISPPRDGCFADGRRERGRFMHQRSSLWSVQPSPDPMQRRRLDPPWQRRHLRVSLVRRCLAPPGPHPAARRTVNSSAEAPARSAPSSHSTGSRAAPQVGALSRCVKSVCGVWRGLGMGQVAAAGPRPG